MERGSIGCVAVAREHLEAIVDICRIEGWDSYTDAVVA